MVEWFNKSCRKQYNASFSFIVKLGKNQLASLLQMFRIILIGYKYCGMLESWFLGWMARRLESCDTQLCHKHVIPPCIKSCDALQAMWGSKQNSELSNVCVIADISSEVSSSEHIPSSRCHKVLRLSNNIVTSSPFCFRLSIFIVVYFLGYKSPLTLSCSLGWQ